MKFRQFADIVRQAGWSVPQLRCDVRPSGEILEFIDRVGDDYEEFVNRYTTVEPKPMNRITDKDFQNPETQRDILLNGSREDIILWLAWNDANGVWSDADSAAEGWKPITFEESRACMRKALSLSPNDPVFHWPKSTEFDPLLPAGADEEVCRSWLRKLCRNFGLGFHPDTPASDYVSSEGQPLSPEVVATLDHSLDRAFEILGDEVPYAVCAEVAEVMMSELSKQSESADLL